MNFFWNKIRIFLNFQRLGTWACWTRWSCRTPSGAATTRMRRRPGPSAWRRTTWSASTRPGPAWRRWKPKRYFFKKNYLNLVWEIMGFFVLLDEGGGPVRLPADQGPQRTIKAEREAAAEEETAAATTATTTAAAAEHGGGRGGGGGRGREWGKLCFFFLFLWWSHHRRISKARYTQGVRAGTIKPFFFFYIFVGKYCMFNFKKSRSFAAFSTTFCVRSPRAPASPAGGTPTRGSGWR